MKNNELESQNIFNKTKVNSFYDELIEKNLKLVAYISKKYKNTGIDSLELLNTGVIGLIKAAHTYDKSKNTLFATYASVCINNEILSFLKKNKQWMCYIRFNIPIYKDDKEILLEDILISNESDFFSKIELEYTYEELRYVLSKLSNRDRKVILLYFGFLNDYCYSQKEISNILGISQSFVSRIIRISLIKLKKELLILENLNYSNKKTKIKSKKNN